MTTVSISIHNSSDFCIERETHLTQGRKFSCLFYLSGHLSVRSFDDEKYILYA